MGELIDVLDENHRLRRALEECRGKVKELAHVSAEAPPQEVRSRLDRLEESLSSHAEATLLPLVVVRAETREVAAVNERFCDLVGKYEPALRSRRLEELFAWVDPTTPERFAGHVLAGRHAPFESAIFTARGEVKDIVVSPSPLDYGGSVAIGLTVVSRRERAETQEIRRQFERFFDLSGDMLFITGDDGYHVRVNEAVLALGFTRDELLSRPAIERVHPDDVERVRRATESLVAGGPSARYECRYRCKDGNERWLRLTTWRDESGTFASSARDVTSEKNETRAIRRLTKELSRSNRELEELATIAAHDLQEPLRKIHMFGDRLREHASESLDLEGADYLFRIQNAAKRGLALIDGLLAYARVATVARRGVDVDLNVVARQVLSDLESQIAKVGGRVECGELPSIEADPLQLRQLFQNLISNALKFHRDDVAPIVHVTARRRAPTPTPTSTRDHDEVWEIIFSDNGIGFEVSHASQLFRLFKRLHGRSKFEGSGIGLAICQRIVDRHGGAISAHGNPAGGAQFVVTLPRHAEHTEGEDDEVKST